MTATSKNSKEPLDTLLVLGVGLVSEMLEQSQVWELLNKKENGSILPTGAHFYLQDSGLRKVAARQRGANALALAIQDFTQNWPIPSVGVWPDKKAPASASENGDAYFSGFIDGLRSDAGMQSHQITSVGAFCRNDPEETIERAFQFMDGYPDVPAILLLAVDGDMTRAMTGDSSREAFWGNGPRRFGSMCETAAAILLARPDRLARLHPFAVSQDVAIARGKELPPGFTPSKFIPAPWTVEQLKQFYAIQPIAEIRRPLRISYRKDKDGKQTFDPSSQTGTMHAKEKEDAVKTGLGTLLSGVNAASIGRIFYDTNGPENGANIVPLSLAIGDALPDMDLFNPKQGYDISRRIGDTGATSPFVQWILAAMASAENKDVSVTANLRQKDEMTLTAIHPARVMQRVAAQAPQKEPQPVSQPTIASAQVTIGTRLPSGVECPQSGMWKSDRANTGGGTTYFIPAGRTLPKLVVENELSSWQKLRGEAAREQVATVWTLVSYEMATT